MSDINCGVFVGEKSGKQYVVLKNDFGFSCGTNSANHEIVKGVDFSPYKTECGMDLSPPNSDNKLFCTELNEFLVKKEN